MGWIASLIQRPSALRNPIGTPIRCSNTIPVLLYASNTNIRHRHVITNAFNDSQPCDPLAWAALCTGHFSGPSPTTPVMMGAHHIFPQSWSSRAGHTCPAVTPPELHLLLLIAPPASRSSQCSLLIVYCTCGSRVIINKERVCRANMIDDDREARSGWRNRLGLSDSLS